MGNGERRRYREGEGEKAKRVATETAEVALEETREVMWRIVKEICSTVSLREDNEAME